MAHNFDEARYLAKRYGRVTAIALMSLRELEGVRGSVEHWSAVDRVSSYPLMRSLEEAAAEAGRLAGHYAIEALAAPDAPVDLAWGGER